MSRYLRPLAGLALCAALAGCATSPRYDSSYPSPERQASRPRSDVLQCVPYARDHSAVKLSGDAYLWWDKAEGHYAKSFIPSEGAILVLYNYAGPNRGHVAVVREVVNERQIRVDHANWLDDGSIFTSDPVQDVSVNNDWSVVRVFNPRTGAWGLRNYPVQGFIGPGPDTGVAPNRLPSDTVPVAAAPRKRDAIAALLAEDDDLDDPSPN